MSQLDEVKYPLTYEKVSFHEFFLKTLRANPVLARGYESIYYNMMAYNDKAYKGGTLQAVQFKNGALAILWEGADSTEDLEIPEQPNYWSGQMSRFALQICMNITACSHLSFVQDKKGQPARGVDALSENYHLLRDIQFSFDSSDVSSMINFLD